MLSFEKIENYGIQDDAISTVTYTGNVVKVSHNSNPNHFQTVRMLEGGESYINMQTGEIKPIVHHEKRIEQTKSLLRTMHDLRDLVNCNTDEPYKCKFITLTYQHNMTDSEKLYDDFKKFNKRFRYHFKDYKIEYIACAEPQERGAWHLHIIYIFDKKAPFIDNDKVAKIWGHGFTKTENLKSGNVGAYLCAYLSDIAVELNISVVGYDTKIVDTDKGKKKIIKGLRLLFYPAGFRLFRCSRGVKRPFKKKMRNDEAMAVVKDMKQIYERTLKIKDSDTDYETIINTKVFQKL